MLGQKALLVILYLSVYTFLNINPLQHFKLDEAKLERQKSRLCHKLPFLDEQNTTEGWSNKWSDKWSKGEVLQLLILRVGYGVPSESSVVNEADFNWRNIVLNTITQLTLRSCRTPLISAKFIVQLKQFFNFYIYKFMRTFNSSQTVTNSNVLPGNTFYSWREIIEALSKCAANIKPIYLTGKCGKVVGYANSNGTEIKTGMIKEAFDVEVELSKFEEFDIVVDGIWWMFSVSYARCYSYHSPKTDAMVMFYLRFRDEIIAQFGNRWRRANGFLRAYPLLFGRQNVWQELLNLRSCASASYGFEGLESQALVRTVTATIKNRKGVNYKV